LCSIFNSLNCSLYYQTLCTSFSKSEVLQGYLRFLITWQFSSFFLSWNKSCFPSYFSETSVQFWSFSKTCAPLYTILHLCIKLCKIMWRKNSCKSKLTSKLSLQFSQSVDEVFLSGLKSVFINSWVASLKYHTSSFENHHITPSWPKHPDHQHVKFFLCCM